MVAGYCQKNIDYKLKHHYNEAEVADQRVFARR